MVKFLRTAFLFSVLAGEAAANVARDDKLSVDEQRILRGKAPKATKAPTVAGVPTPVVTDTCSIDEFADITNADGDVTACVGSVTPTGKGSKAGSNCGSVRFINTDAGETCDAATEISAVWGITGPPAVRCIPRPPSSRFVS